MGQTSFIHPAQGVLFAEGISLEAIALKKAFSRRITLYVLQ